MERHCQCKHTHSLWSVGEIQAFRLSLQFLHVLLRQFHIAHSQILNGLQHYSSIKKKRRVNIRDITLLNVGQGLSSKYL